MASDIVEVHIDPVWGRPQQGVGQIAGGLVINDVVDTNVPEKSALVRAACRSYDRVPFKLGNLAGDRPNGTSRGRDKHHVARLKRGYLQKAAPGRQTRHAGNAQERLRREPQRIELLHGAGRRVESLPPTKHGRDEIAWLETWVLGRNNFPDRASLQRFAQLEQWAPAVHSRIGRGNLSDFARWCYLAQRKVRVITRAIDHATAHVGVDRHPEILHLHFAKRGGGHGHRGELEIIRTGRADKAFFQTDFAGRDHDRGSRLLIRQRRSRRHRIADDFAPRQDQDVTLRSISRRCQYTYRLRRHRA